MLAPQQLLEGLTEKLSGLLQGDQGLPRPELERQVKSLLQGAFTRLDLVSRDEFDGQMLVLARTRSRLEALEQQVAELESRLASSPTGD